MQDWNVGLKEAMKMKRLVLAIIILTLTLTPFASAQEATPAYYKLDMSRIGHVPQTWNNCGGATITMGLSYFGYPANVIDDQRPAREYLKPNWEDQNVSPWQVVDYVNRVAGPTWGVQALVRRGGDLDLLKSLLANNFPVIIEKGYEVDDLDWMGHYLLMVGYDDANANFFTYDSYLGSNGGEGRSETYNYIQTYWRHFNDTFIVLYSPMREAELQSLLGDLWDEAAGWQRAKARAQMEAANDPSDAWAWFNLGEAASALGEYDVAAVAFRTALDTGRMPWRTMWYLHGAFEAFYHTGQFKTVLELAATLQQITPYIEEANYYRGLVYAAQGKTEDAIFRFDRVLEFNPNFYLAEQAKQAIQNGTFVGPIQTDA